jgi:hypothetical protein
MKTDKKITWGVAAIALALIIYSIIVWPVEPEMIGDVDNNGERDLWDVMFIQHYVLGQLIEDVNAKDGWYILKNTEVLGFTREFHIDRADVNGDCQVTAADVTRLSHWLKGYRDVPLERGDCDED